MSFWDQVKATAAEIGEKAQEGAHNLKVTADREIEKAKQSETWAKAKEGSSQAWEKTKEGAKNVSDQAQTTMRGKLNKVTFHDPKLGMTLARDENSGQAIVSRVDADGPAGGAGVNVGNRVISMRSGYESDGTGEPDIKIESYDHLMGLFPAMGRPITITFQQPRTSGSIPNGGVVNFSMEEELDKAAKILEKLTTERATNPDALIPLDILRRARGLAFIRIAKIGFGFSVKVGTGIVVARLGDSLDSWSAPCAIGTAGVGMGFQWGAELTDFMIVLNTQEAVEAFASGNQVSLGGNVGIAVGPVGRNAGLSGNIHGGDLASRDEAGNKTKVQVAPCYAYSHSKGLFIGISLEGAVIKPRRDVNAKFYGPEQDPRLILSGSTPPPALAEPLYDLLISTSADPEADLRRYQYSGGGASEPEPVTSEPVGTYSAANPFNDADTETSPEHTQSFLSEKNDFPVATPISKGDEDSSQLL